jgi:hypothetical protein
MFALTVDDQVILYRTEKEALDSLRINFANGDDVADSELINFVRSQGVKVYLNWVDISEFINN